MATMNSAQLRVLGVSPGEPFAPRTVSDVAKNLFTSLQRRGALAGAVSMRPSRLEDFAIKLRAFTFPRRRWVQRYRLSSALVDAFHVSAVRNIRSVAPLDYQAILQIGAHCNLANFVGVPIFTYHDNDVITLIETDPRMKDTPRTWPSVRERIALEKSVFDAARRVFTFSEWIAGEIRCNYAVPADRVQAVGAGANLDTGLVSGERDYASRNAIFLAYDFHGKGGDDVLAAFRHVRAQVPTARLTIAGGLRAGEIAPGVRSLGILHDKAQVAELYRSGSFYVMPSTWEPFGIAFVEAMASGLSCIGSNICAMPEIIGETGFVVPPRDPDRLAQAMLQLYESATAERLGRAARARYENYYGWDKVAARMENAMRSALEEAG